MVGIYFIESCFFYVEDLTAKRQNCLEARVTSLLCRAACGVSLYQVELGELCVLFLTVSKLSGECRAFEKSLAACCLACLSCGFASAVCSHCFFQDCLADCGIFLKIFLKLFGNERIENCSHFAVAELALGLTLKLCLGELYRYDRRKTFTHVLTREVLFALFDDAVLSAVVVKDLCQSCLKADLVRTTFNGVDVICKGEQRLVVAVVILHCNLCNPVFLFGLHIDDLGMDQLTLFLVVNIFNKGFDTTLINQIVLAIGAVLKNGTLVAQTNVYTTVEECLLAQSLEQRVVIEYDLLKHFGVGQKANVKTVAVGFSLLFEGARDVTALEPLGIALALVAVIDFNPRGKRVYNRCTNAVQTSGIFIAVTAKFAARVQNGIDHLKRGNAHFGVNTTRNTATVILHGYAVIRVKRDLYALTAAGQCLVDGVIDNFIHQMVKTARRGRPDIHTRSLSDGFKSFQYLNLTFVINALFQIFHFLCFLSVGVRTFVILSMG